MAKHITYTFSVEAMLPLTDDPEHPDFYMESVATSVKFRADLERAMLSTLRRFEAEVTNLEILDFSVEDDGLGGGAACCLCDAAFDTEEDAEACERRHGLEHDAWCSCQTCQYERAADTAQEPRR